MKFFRERSSKGASEESEYVDKEKCMKYQVLVRLKPGVLDVQGKTIERNLEPLGISGLEDFRVGRLIEFEDTSADSSSESAIEKLCNELLSNPVIEDFEVKTVG